MTACYSDSPPLHGKELEVTCGSFPAADILTGCCQYIFVMVFSEDCLLSSKAPHKPLTVNTATRLLILYYAHDGVQYSMNKFQITTISLQSLISISS